MEAFTQDEYARLPHEIHPAQCATCGYECAATETALYEYGPPLCPCNGKPMACDRFEEMRAQAEEYERPKTIRDHYLILRSIQYCDRCRCELAHGESARHRVTTLEGEFSSTYTCFQCDDPSRACRRALPRETNGGSTPIDFHATNTRGRARATRKRRATPQPEAAVTKAKSTGKRGGARPGAGRPRNPNTVPSTNMTIRLPKRLDAQIRSRSKLTHTSVSAWVRDVLRRSI